MPGSRLDPRPKVGRDSAWEDPSAKLESVLSLAEARSSSSRSSSTTSNNESKYSNLDPLPATVYKETPSALQRPSHGFCRREGD
ncbi:uncharacterized protein BT62DRAFT_1014276 [Guyanagaster necrorhizus]|uniref:Uncharacterized protein n=1 Tax=Guyanagaster necrorhizus TaxID=856835 RepID=A0A9P7VFF9_9AGAR|nr:uncharacterized protein BT62DRAFT_1014267 [Guyanagaster necrorhizus MCA 3950]XP_043032685.1 uncharacterized protein BT62DRAFT_1014276 [Guyanagaster necrorhizus MCA 3950]KAG7439171.1 hypothetical protein BT62DRAFT_1014267 [Guyanagaster necrorhizus MCA 3950]KAG7439181.1 hypothetical protein BT62DRAFT_1014276 [Guyanagaster necrorhizus MCA 3950]